MANLKDLKVRISSVQSTRKITSAMKMVAAAKLRRAQESAEAARPFAIRMERMLGSLAASLGSLDGAPKMLAGNGKDQTHLLVAFTADRGLCGGFNGSIVRQIRSMAHKLTANGKMVKVLFVGRKAHDVLKREFSNQTVDVVIGIGKKGVEFSEATGVADKITTMFEADEFDVCTIVFNRFQSAMTQIVTPQQLIPFTPAENGETGKEVAADKSPKSVYMFEPNEEEILADLLPRNLGMQIFQAMLESSASEHGARMSAMDSASRNAGDMIDSLTMTYNRTRQAVITKELIEIISGAEAL